MTIFEINKLQIACFMFKVNTQQLPSYFSDLFLYKTVPYIVTTLDSLLTIIYLTVVLKLDSCIAIYGAKIWNSLDENLKSSVTLQNFKYIYKKYLLKI